MRTLWLLSVAALAQAPPPLYTSPSSLSFGTQSLNLPYTDAAGLTRTIPTQVRVPVTGQVLGNTLLPVVVWSQVADLKTWSETTARAGYLTVTVAHPTRNDGDKAALCKALSIEPAACIAFDAAAWDRVQDLLRVLAALEVQNQSGPNEIRGRIDLSRIAVGGFGEGASATLTLAGATRLIRPSATREKPDALASPRPIAYIALSPPGPLHEGFYDTDTFENTHSWQKIDRSVLSITAAGDNTCQPHVGCNYQGSAPSIRAMTFDLMPTGGKYLMFLHTVEIDHDFLGSLDTTDCDACLNPSRWMRASVLAYLDAVVRKLPAAAAWIAEGTINAASGKAVTWRKK